MATGYQYRPRFVDIRVKPAKAEDDVAANEVHARKPGERPCDHVGCSATAATRAPKSRDLLGDHYWFCQPHAAEYNRSWNFFAGMSEGEVRARMVEDLATGGRPTWSFKAGARNKEAAGGRAPYRDPFGIFGAAKVREDDARMAAERRIGKLERTALIDLDLDATADGPAIRVRYLELVKRCHPDSNGGDRSAEHKLQRVLKAYKTLQKAKLV
jgi:hypothetical protein